MDPGNKILQAALMKDLNVDALDLMTGMHPSVQNQR